MKRIKVADFDDLTVGTWFWDPSGDLSMVTAVVVRTNGTQADGDDYLEAVYWIEYRGEREPPSPLPDVGTGAPLRWWRREFRGRSQFILVDAWPSDDEVAEAIASIKAAIK